MKDLEFIEYVNNWLRIFRDRYNPLETLNDIDFIETISTLKRNNY